MGEDTVMSLPLIVIPIAVGLVFIAIPALNRDVNKVRFPVALATAFAACGRRLVPARSPIVYSPPYEAEDQKESDEQFKRRGVLVPKRRHRSTRIHPR